MGLTKVTYSMIEGAEFNAFDYGAVGDGVTNDTAAIQAAVTAASVAGGTVVLSAGNYLITSSIIFTGDNVSFSGVGAASKIIVSASWSSPSSDAVFFIDQRENIVVSNLQCDLDNIAIAAEITETNSSKIDSCVFNDAPTFVSVNIIIKENCADITVTNCVFVRSLNYSVAVNDSKRVIVSNCSSYDGEGRVGFNSGAEECVATSNTFYMTIDRTPGQGVPGFSLASCARCTVVGNTIVSTASKLGTGADGISISSTEPNIVTGNTISGFRIGVDVNNSSKFATISNNTITDCTYGVGSDFGASDCVVSGNIIKDCDYGIGENLAYFIIQANIIRDCGVGISLATNARVCVIDSNQIIFTQEEAIVINSTGAVQKHKITNNNLYGVGLSAAVEGTYYGIRAEKLYDCYVCYNTIDILDGSLRPNGFITVAAGSENTIAFNQIFNTTPGNRIVAAAGDQVYKNVNFFTEIRGDAVIPSGSTFIAVTFSPSLSITPTAQNISVVPTNSLGNATKFFVSNISNLGFRITVDVDPGATTATFSYSVSTI